MGENLIFGTFRYISSTIWTVIFGIAAASSIIIGILLFPIGLLLFIPAIIFGSMAKASWHSKRLGQFDEYKARQKAKKMLKTEREDKRAREILDELKNKENI